MAYQLIASYAHPEDPEAFLDHYANVHAPIGATFPDLRAYTWVVCETPDGTRPEHFVIATLTWDSRDQALAALASEPGKAAVADLATFAQAGVALEFGEVRQGM